MDYAIGSKKWPGLGKFIEEASEAITVCGKLIATDGDIEYYDGTDLKTWLEHELADVIAAAEVLVALNGLDMTSIQARIEKKAALFTKWHMEHSK